MRFVLNTKNFLFFFFYLCELFKLLIFNKNFFAFQTGILLKAASWLVSFLVKRILSTKFSTDFVDSKKKAYGI